MALEFLAAEDPQVTDCLRQELARQRGSVELIASENFTSRAVMEAVGSVLTNKYAEGYPGKRYYGGCEKVDMVEDLARDRACELYGAKYANVQPHSGASANFGAYLSIIEPGDTVLGMSLDHGGHLTHGSPVNFSGLLYNIVSYGVNPETETIDYDELERIAKECRPKVIVGGASAYPRFIDFERMAEIAHEVGAYLMVDMAHIAGLVAAGLHPTPIGHAHVTTTTTHKTLRGPRGGMILSDESFGKTLNSQIFPGIQGGPLMHIVAAKAVAFGEALRPRFKDYQVQVLRNTVTLGEELKNAKFNLVSGGTDNHLLLVDLTSKDITGKDAEHALDAAGITVNKNTVPFETRSPFVTSGIRIGTPALTTRGFREQDMVKVAGWIDAAIANAGNETRLAEISKEVAVFARQFPLFAW